MEKREEVLRYRMWLPDIINCGFPFYYVEDGQRGVFYLKGTEDPDPEDISDGFIDNFDFVHFRPRPRG